MPKKFEVVVSGISGRFPECDDINTFKKKLYDLENFITNNDNKWSPRYKCGPDSASIPRATGKYTDMQSYDYPVFKFSADQARVHDILSRKILEPSFEAIADAGVNPHSLDGDNVGVYMACGIDEFEAKMSTNDAVNKILAGVARTMQSNRVSYVFNFTGPSCTYQTDVLGSLRAFCAGYEAVADGTANSAIVGVASNMNNSQVSRMYFSLGFLSQDGLCRSLDKHANGYGRSEGAIVFFLQRAEEAKRNYGTILFCEDHYFGLNSSTLLQYKEDVIGNSIRSIYDSNNFTEMAPQLAFMELNACGIKRFESAELNSIADIVCKNRNSPLLAGSVKSNVGHTEASAALMSLLKVLFALDTEIIAPNANFNEPNDELGPLKYKQLQVVSEKTRLPGFLAGVNAIGLSGVVSHAVLKQNPKAPKASEHDKLPRLLLICGRTEDGLRNAIRNIEKVPYNREFIALTNDVFSSHMSTHSYRGYTILPKQLGSKSIVEKRGHRNRPLWFVFSGMGSQWNGMGEGLLDLPIFSNTIEKCHEILRQKGVDLYHILTSDDPILFDNVLYSFVSITCMQIALLEVLKAVDIRPDGIIGHSAGEIGCAYADGCLTLEQAVLSSYERGMACDASKTVNGTMAAIGLGYKDIKDSLPDGVEVACHNSAVSCTLSGPTEKVTEFVEQLTTKGIFNRIVNVANIAFHSTYIRPFGPRLLSSLKEVIPNPKERSPKWISTSIPECEWNGPLAKHCSAEYMKNNLLSSVLFEEGCQHIPENAIVIEIAPHGHLQAILKKSLPPSCTNISLTFRSKTKDNLTYLLSALGKLYIAGGEPNVNNLFPKVSYPVPRGTPSISPFCTWYHEEPDNKEITFLKPTPDRNSSLVTTIVRVQEDADYGYLRFHRINEQIIIPPSLYMYFTWKTFSYERNEGLENSSILFENIRIHKNISVSIKKPRHISVMIQISGYFEVVLENKENTDEKIVTIMSGRIEVPNENVDVNIVKKFVKFTRFVINKEQFYLTYKNVGYHLTDSFACVEELLFNATECYGKITWNDNWVIFLDSLMKFHMYSSIRRETDLFYPYFVRKLYINCPLFAKVKIGAPILCHKDLITQRVRCDGLEMCGLGYKMFPSKTLTGDFPFLKVQGLEFVSYDDPRCQGIGDFLSLCLQISVENVHTGVGKSQDRKLRIVECEMDYSDIISGIIRKNKYLKSNVKFVQHTKMVPQGDPLFLLTNNIKQAQQLDADNLFVLTVTDTNYFEKSFIVITKQTFSGKTFCLLKRKPNKNGYLNPELKNQESSSTSAPEIRENEGTFPLIVRRLTEATDLDLMLSRYKRDYDKSYVFLVDNDETHRYEEFFIKSPIVRYLPYTVFKNGECGIYRHIANNPKFTRSSILDRMLSINIKLESIRCTHFCADYELRKGLENVDYNEDYSYGIEYSGIEYSGKRVMGLSLVNSLQPVTHVDPLLTWQIPNDWEMEDAATVPFVYAQAYYILRLANSSNFVSSALINMGNEILLTEVCIRLLLQKGVSVYVTVSNKSESIMIRKKFPQLEEFRILYKDGCQYERQLKYLTKKKGVDVVVNCFSGLEHTNASMACAGNISFYVEVNDQNFKDVYRIGMQPFLNVVSFLAIPSKMSFLLSIPPEDRRILQQDVQEGITSGIVTPFPKLRLTRGISTYDDFKTENVKVVIKCESEKEVHINTNEKPQSDGSNSYIIVGDHHSENSWTELVKWLIGKGALKFIVVLENLFVESKLASTDGYFLNKKEIYISFKSAGQIGSTVQEASNLIAEANEIGNLEAVYFVSVKSIGKMIRNLDFALGHLDSNKNVRFVSIFSGGLRELESRRSKGLPAALIHGERTKNLTNLLPDLDHILIHSNHTESPTLYRVEEISKLDSKQTFSTLYEFLPKCLKTLEKTGGYDSKIPTFEERTTLSPPYRETRGVYPIFIIPSLHGEHLDPLIRRLMYPAYSATLPATAFSISEVAQILHENIKKIQPAGPITIIGETWNAILSIELSLLIKSSGRKYRLFLLEGNPADWKERLTSLGDINSAQFQNNLFRNIFDFGRTLDNDHELRSISSNSFEDRVKNYLSTFVSNGVNREFVIRAANTIRNRLLSVLQHEATDYVLHNTILFTRNFSKQSTLKLSVSSNLIIIKETSYENFLKNAEVISALNDNAAFSWWD